MAHKGLKKYFTIWLSALLIGIISPFALAQGTYDSEKDLKSKAGKAYNDDRFSEALPLYSQLLSLYPKDPEITYRYGVCLLETGQEREKCISYLFTASKSPEVDSEVYFFLGKALHLNYRFDEALVNYGIFKSKASNRSNTRHDVDRQMAMCQNGKTLLSSIGDLVVLQKNGFPLSDYFRAYNLGKSGERLIQKPEELKSPLDKKKGENSPIIVQPNQRYLYFASFGDKAENGKELYRIAKGEQMDFNRAEHLGKVVNSPYDEDFPYATADGKTLFFSSKGHNSMGGYDVFKSEWDEVNQAFLPPVNLDYTINTPDDDLLYVVNSEEQVAFFSSRRNSGPGSITVYKIKTERPSGNLVLVKGVFHVDQETNHPAAKIQVRNLTNGRMVGTYSPNPKTGDFQLMLRVGSKYEYRVETAGFTAQTKEVQIPESTGSSMLRQRVSYNRVDQDEILTIISEYDALALDETSKASMAAMLRAQANLDQAEGETPTATAQKTEAPKVDPVAALVSGAFASAKALELEAEGLEREAEEQKQMASVSKDSAAVKFRLPDNAGNSQGVELMKRAEQYENTANELMQRAREVRADQQEETAFAQELSNLSKEEPLQTLKERRDAFQEKKKSKQKEREQTATTSQKSMSDVTQKRDEIETKLDEEMAALQQRRDRLESEREQAKSKAQKQALNAKLQKLDREIKDKQEAVQLAKIHSSETSLAQAGADNKVMVPKEGVQGEPNQKPDGVKLETWEKRNALKIEQAELTQKLGQNYQGPNSVALDEAASLIKDADRLEEKALKSTVQASRDRSIAQANALRAKAVEMERRLLERPVAETEPEAPTLEPEADPSLARIAQENLPTWQKQTKESLYQNHPQAPPLVLSPADLNEFQSDPSYASYLGFDKKVDEEEKKINPYLEQAEQVESDRKRVLRSAEELQAYANGLKNERKREDALKAIVDKQVEAKTFVARRDSLLQQAARTRDEANRNREFANSIVRIHVIRHPQARLVKASAKPLPSEPSPTVAAVDPVVSEKSEGTAIQPSAPTASSEKKPENTEAKSTEPPVSEDKGEQTQKSDPAPQGDGAGKADAVSKKAVGDESSEEDNGAESAPTQFPSNPVERLVALRKEADALMAASEQTLLEAQETGGRKARDKAAQQAMEMEEIALAYRMEADSLAQLPSTATGTAAPIASGNVDIAQNASTETSASKTAVSTEQPAQASASASASTSSSAPAAAPALPVSTEPTLRRKSAIGPDGKIPGLSYRPDEIQAILSNPDYLAYSESRHRVDSAEYFYQQNASKAESLEKILAREKSDLFELEQLADESSGALAKEYKQKAKDKKPLVKALETRTDSLFDIAKGFADAFTKAEVNQEKVSRKLENRQETDYQNIYEKVKRKFDGSDMELIAPVVAVTEPTSEQKPADLGTTNQATEAKIGEAEVKEKAQEETASEKAGKSAQAEPKKEEVTATENADLKRAEPAVKRRRNKKRKSAKADQEAEARKASGIQQPAEPVTRVSQDQGLAIDGQAAYSSSAPIPYDNLPKDGIRFMVQIGAFKRKVAEDAFGPIKPVCGETSATGMIRYIAGDFQAFESASQARRQLAGLGYADAFVVAFCKGRRIPVAEARRLIAAGLDCDGGALPARQIVQATEAQTTEAQRVEEEDMTEILSTQGNLKQYDKLLYTVQVGVYKRLIPARRLYNLSPLYYDTLANRNIRYSIGLFDNLAGAIEARNRVVDVGIRDAFVIPFYNRKRIRLEEAQELEAREGKSVLVSGNGVNKQVEVGGAPTVEGAARPVASGNADSAFLRVQIGVFRNAVPLEVMDTFLRLASSRGISSQKGSDGLTTFTVGNLKDLKEANELKASLQKDGLTDAFVVGYVGKKKVSVDEVLLLLRKSKP